MHTKYNIKFYARKRDSLLRKMGNLGPFIDGSLVTIARACGNLRCRCARGEKHVSFYLTYKPPRSSKGKASKTKTIYVPVALEDEVRTWTLRHKRLKEIIHEVSHLQRTIIRSYVTQKGRAKRPRKER
jgi:hypothetical protein